MRVNFTAAEHGFAFANSFVNHVVRIPALGIDITTKGRCGGMAAAALDHWHAGLAMPESSILPQDGSLVGDYVYSRLIDTMIDNGAKFVHYATSLDHPTWLRGQGRQPHGPRGRAAPASRPASTPGNRSCSA